MKIYEVDPPQSVRQRLLIGFADGLRRHRMDAGFSQEQLASESGIHRTEISLLERGQREPRLLTLIKLASALGVPPERLSEAPLALYEWVPREGWRER